MLQNLLAISETAVKIVGAASVFIACIVGVAIFFFLKKKHGEM
jgi:hypothetical protein